MRHAQPPLIELRHYVIAPGRRDRMIELFDTQFVDAQDALGLPILGHFRAEGEPDGLVWLRGFADMQSRPERLGAFYGGPTWTEFGPEAIALVTDYSNVQLLLQAAPGSAIAVDLDDRPATAVARATTVVIASTYRLHAPPDDDFVDRAIAAVRAMPSARLLGAYVGDPTPNNFPPLPIRQGEHLFTWFAACPADAAATLPEEQALAPAFAAVPERLILHPAARSLLP